MQICSMTGEISFDVKVYKDPYSSAERGWISASEVGRLGRETEEP